MPPPPAADPKKADPAADKGATTKPDAFVPGTPAPADPYIWGPSYAQVDKGTAVFSKGQKGPGVDRLQEDLANLGYPSGNPRGKFGPNTEVAVAKFQTDHQLKPTGVADQKTIQVMQTEVNKQGLERDPNFKGLSPAHQQGMREAQAKGPRDPQLTKDLRDLAGNDRFRNLSSDTASEVLKRVGPDVAARTNLTGLATSDGFGKLNATHQKKALEALDQAPGDAVLANDLRGLTSSGDFRNLSDGAKSQALDGMKAHAADPAARGTIAGLAKSPGLGKLADEDKAALLRVTTSDDKTYGPAARAEVDKLIQDPGWSKKSADDQAKALKKVLDDQSFLPHATTAPDGTFSAPGKRVPYTVSAPTDLGGGVKSYEIEVEGKKFPVKISPAPAGTAQYTPDDVGKSLASIPKKYRDQIQEVKLEPAVDPENAYMRSSGAGTVYVYPGTPPLAGEDFMASAMLHETGHIVSGKAYGDDTNDPRWKTWKDAMQKDGVATSKYGHTIAGKDKTVDGGAPYADDFAETLLLYGRVKGTPEEAKMRALFPERFKVLDSM